MQLQHIVIRPRGNTENNIAYQRTRMLPHRQHLKASRFNLRKINNILNQKQQHIARRFHLLGILKDILRPALAEYHLIHTDNDIEWCPNLMAYIDKEIALCLIRRLGLSHRTLKLYCLFFKLPGPFLLQFIP